MPTPVTTARQCLTADSAHALDEAVTVARRRNHSQTTSLHAVSALLSISTSPLRDACARARNSTYSSRLQFKALDLCLSVSLDRIPATQRRIDDDDCERDREPPVSNSLMAAIRRSQANQRRQPENFQYYTQIQRGDCSSSSSVSCVRVEIRHLILSILDDPIVSRVFAESGFRSSDIKLAVLRPLPQVFKYSRSRVPPVFLCNLTENSGRSFSFPFSGYTGVTTGDENCRRIGEILARSKGRNPLLVGVYAYDALQGFASRLNANRYDVLPVELSELNIISIENEVSRFLTDKNEDVLTKKLKFEEAVKVVEHDLASGPGLVVNIGDLKTLIGSETCSDALKYVVSRLTGLLEIHGRQLWLIGAVASYEMYLSFVGKYPSIEKDWDSQILPITSMKPSYADDSYSRSSLMESFVPFAGFFSTPSDLKGIYSDSYECGARCTICNEKCEEEVTALCKDISTTASVVDLNQSSLPPWLQMAELDKTKSLDVEKARDGVLMSAKIQMLQKKWDGICNRLHHSQTLAKSVSCQPGSQFKTIMGFQFIKDSKETADNCSSSSTCVSPNGTIVKGSITISSSKQSTPPPITSVPIDESSMSTIFQKPSETKESHTSTNSAASVTTDLGLRMFSSSCSSHPFPGIFDPSNAKMLYNALAEKIGWQEEAISLVSQTIASCRTSNEKRHGSSSRGDIWLTFLGPDTIGKKKVAVALAEILFGSKENLISADLRSQNGIFDASTNNARIFRGKTVVDHIADELGKKKLSVVYIENVDNADLAVQNSLLGAIRTGKFSDSHGREVSINNAVFVTTLNSIDETDEILEEIIFRAKTIPIQFQISLKCDSTFKNGNSGLILVNKRKMTMGRSDNIEGTKTSEIAKRANKSPNIGLDLNLPAEDHETTDQEDSEKCSNSWLADFFNQADKTVTFKSFNLDAITEKLHNSISKSFRKINGSDYALEIDTKVIDQLVAAHCLSDNSKTVESWVELVLNKGFEKAKRKYNLTARSVLKLVASDEPFSEKQGPPFLPHRISLH